MARILGLSLDLNVAPDCQDQLRVGVEIDVCSDSRDREGTCTQESSSQLVIDVDDEVLPSSSKSFCQARRTSQTRKRSIVISDDDDDVEICGGLPPYFKVRKRKRSTLCQQHRYHNQKEYIDLEAAPIKGDNVQEPAQLPQQVPTVEAHTFSCPICMDKLKNETSTKCGHIFCEECIKKALTAKKCCPTCRKKLRAKDIIRIYLPDVNGT